MVRMYPTKEGGGYSHLPSEISKFCGQRHLGAGGFAKEGLIPTKHMFAYVCSNCGAEHVAGFYTWEAPMTTQELMINYSLSGDAIRDLRNAINARFEQSLEIESDLKHDCFCSVCGNSLLPIKGFFKKIEIELDNANSVLFPHFYEQAHQPSFDLLFSEIEKERNELFLDKAHTEAEDCMKAIVKKTIIEDDLTFDCDKILASSHVLETYLFHILKIEANEYALRQHLLSLYEEQQKIKLKTISANQKEAQKLYEDTICPAYRAPFNLEYDEIEPTSVIHPPAPVKPETLEKRGIYKPLEPEYKTPNIFNKKKVIEENEIKERNYAVEKKHYEDLRAKYENELVQYEAKLSQYQEDCAARELEAETNYKSAIKAQEQQRIDEETALKKEHESLVKNAYTKFSLRHDTQGVVAYLKQEIDRIETLLFETIKTKNELYSKNIVYSKYRNMVAISCFCDYLKAGRVDSLKGTNGAYNLYEAEIRSNLIITKLSDVVDSLETIKENQGMLYNTLNDIDHHIQDINVSIGEVIKGIGKLNETAEDVADLLASIDSSSATTAKNTSAIAQNTQLIAHHSEVTAYYTKKNAEIADAIGFMVALK